MDDFFVNNLQANNLDRYVIRQAIFKFIGTSLPLMEGKLLDAGCGKMPYKDFILKNTKVTDYIGLDIENALLYDQEITPDYTWNGEQMPFESNQFNGCMATEVLEHCPEPEVFLNEVARVLKPHGTFFFTVPFIWNLHEVPHDEYRYTPFSLERHLKRCGFQDIKLQATGGWHAAMAQMIGLWVRRAPMSNRKRSYLSRVVIPVIHFLLAKDRKYSVTFSEGQMITGLCGIAKV